VKADTANLWTELAAAGLVSGEPPEVGECSPWYVRLMLGIGGWLGALFVLGFVGAALALLLKSSGAALLAGTLLCAGAGFLFRLGRGVFAAQFGLVLGFAGQALALFAFMKLGGQHVGPLLFALYEVPVVLLLASGANRLVATCAAALAAGTGFTSHGLSQLVPALVTVALAVTWLNELCWSRRGAIARAVGYGLLLAAIAFDLVELFGPGLWPVKHGASEVLLHVDHWLGVMLKAAALLFVVWQLLLRERGRIDGLSMAVVGVAALASLGLHLAPGLVTALLAMVLGFANGNRVLTGIGIIAGIFYLGDFYYQLEATLLEKAAVLVATGLLLLAARAPLFRLWPGTERLGGENA
jgi:hypothetical protein